MKKIAILYLATLLIIVPLDALWLGVVARGFFKSQVGDMLGDLNVLPALLFYLLYVVGILIFVSNGAAGSWTQALLYGALFGFFAYMTYDLTNLAILKHWTWAAAAVDIAWGSFATAVAAAGGVIVAQWATRSGWG